MAPSKMCNRCRAPAALMCQRCHDGYCSPDCQISDWPQHKQLCIPMPTLVPITPPKHVFQSRIGPVAATPLPRALKPSTTQEIEAARDSRPVTPQPLILTPVVNVAAAPEKELPLAADNQPKCPAPVFSNKADTMAVPPPPQFSTQPTGAPAHIVDIAVTPPIVSKPAVTNMALQAILQRRRPATVADVVVIATPAAAAAKSVDVLPAVIAPNSPAVLPNSTTADAATKPTAIPPTIPAKQTPPAAIAPPAAWQQPTPLETGSAVHKLLVQHIDEDDANIIYAILAANETPCMQLLADMNAALDNAASADVAPVSAADIAVGRLFAVPFEDVFYRAVVLKDDSAVNEIYFQLLDYGNRLFVALDRVRRPLPAMLAQPAFAVRLRLRRQRKPAVGETLTVRVVDTVAGVYRAEELPAPAPMQSASSAAAATATITKTSTNAPIVSATVCQPAVAAAALVPSSVRLETVAAAPPKKLLETVEAAPPTFTMRDLQVVPLPVGQPLRLSCLDTSELENGLITAAVFDEDRLRHITQELTLQIAAFCSGPLARVFAPRPGDMCLAIFDEDTNWYRALCVDASRPDVVQVMFVDYGNVTTVSAQNVRNIPAELAADPCLANSCVIEGVPDHIPVDRIRAYLEANPVFPIGSATEIENNCYLIQVEV